MPPRYHVCDPCMDLINNHPGHVHPKCSELNDPAFGKKRSAARKRSKRRPAK